MKKIIHVNEAKKKLDSKEALLIDVRTPGEFDSAHIGHSYNIPLDELEKYAKKLSKLNKDLLIICKTGRRAGIACEKLKSIHKKGLFVIEGGITAWIQNGLRVQRGKEKWELERQVRLVAGSLVFIGFLFGFFLNPYWHLLSGFVGLGLAFAALTNTCAMGMLVAKLPYNKGSDYKVRLKELFREESAEQVL